MPLRPSWRRYPQSSPLPGMAIFPFEGISRQGIALHVMKMHELAQYDISRRRAYRNPIFYDGFVAGNVAAGYLEAERNVLPGHHRISIYLEGSAARDGGDRGAHIVLRVEKQEAAVSHWFS